MADDDAGGKEHCPVFGVQSGVPVIGLGLLILFFGIIPLIWLRQPVPIPVTIVFIGFGLFLVWAGMTQ